MCLPSRFHACRSWAEEIQRRDSHPVLLEFQRTSRVKSISLLTKHRNLAQLPDNNRISGKSNSFEGVKELLDYFAFIMTEFNRPTFVCNHVEAEFQFTQFGRWKTKKEPQKRAKTASTEHFLLIVYDCCQKWLACIAHVKWANTQIRTGGCQKERLGPLWGLETDGWEKENVFSFLFFFTQPVLGTQMCLYVH